MSKDLAVAIAMPLVWRRGGGLVCRFYSSVAGNGYAPLFYLRGKEAAMRKSRPKKSILIIEDDESMRETLKIVLEKRYKIFLSVSANNAFQIIEKENINVILLDLHLPDMAGLELAKVIKRNNSARIKYIEIILITIRDNPRIIEECLREGIFWYIDMDSESLMLVEFLIDLAIEHQALKQERYSFCP